MKTYLYTSFLFLFFVINISYGQTFEFADSNAVWSVSDKKYFIQGDSVYNSFTYQKIFVENGSVITAGNFFALIREDLVENKLYAISKDSVNEHLLYDFSLNVGDQTTVFPLEDGVHSGPVNVKVDAIDNIYIDNAFRRKLKISGVDQNTGITEEWIEGIGSTFGLFGSGLTGVVVFDAFYPVLLCYEEDSVLLYDNPDYSTCYEPSSSLDKHLKTIGIKIHPNPSSQNIVVESDLIEVEYKIFSIGGRLIKEGNIGLNKKINISEIPDGVYHIKLISKDRIGIKKFVKIS
ncbi:MAG: T9SS type A sorting domain-containing protein [Brumimicrobium sp.]|nr:T9SS type A sorting domain-containing protein [Brumimicrobium sp.]